MSQDNNPNDGENGNDTTALQAAAIGAGAGAAVGGPAGALAGGVLGLLSQYGVSEDDLSEHHRAVVTGVNTLTSASAVRDQTRIRFAHIADEINSEELGAEHGTGGDVIAPNVDGRPDILLSDVGYLPKLTVEVEDRGGLSDPSHVIDQLERYATPGRKLILAVPDDDWDRLQTFLDAHGDEIAPEFHSGRVSELDQFV